MPLLVLGPIAICAEGLDPGADRSDQQNRERHDREGCPGERRASFVSRWPTGVRIVGDPDGETDSDSHGRDKKRNAPKRGTARLLRPVRTTHEVRLPRLGRANLQLISFCRSAIATRTDARRLGEESKKSPKLL